MALTQAIRIPEDIQVGKYLKEGEEDSLPIDEVPDRDINMFMQKMNPKEAAPKPVAVKQAPVSVAQKKVEQPAAPVDHHWEHNPQKGSAVQTSPSSVAPLDTSDVQL